MTEDNDKIKSRVRSCTEHKICVSVRNVFYFRTHAVHDTHSRTKPHYVPHIVERYVWTGTDDECHVTDDE